MTIKALFNEPNAVLPGTGVKPQNYVTVRFDLDDKGTTEDPLKFYVDPNRTVNVPLPRIYPKLGYTFKEWGSMPYSVSISTEAKKAYGKFTSDTVIKAQYAESDEVVAPAKIFGFLTRSEERRVGKECRSRWSPYH